MKRLLILILLCAPLALSASCAPKGKSQATAPKPSKGSLLQPAPPPAGTADKYAADKKPVEDSSPLFVQPNGLYLRECPSKDCKIMATLLKGQQVKPLNFIPGWLEVAIEEKGMIGWLGSKHVAKGDGEAPLIAPVPITEQTQPAAAEAPAQDSAQPVAPEIKPVSADQEKAASTAAQAETETVAKEEAPAKPMKAPPPPKEEFSPGTKAPKVETN
jgi:hypothetical protein